MFPRNQASNSHTPIQRHISTLTATSIVIANIIGAGIFTTSGILSGMLPGPGWILFCWIFGGLVAMSGALCYAELATRMPEEGAEYVYLNKLYHPLLGFLTGWTSFFVGFSAAIAASAMGSSEYFFAGLDGTETPLSSIQLLIIKKASAILLILAFTSLHYRGIRTGSWVQNLLTLLKIFIVLSLALAGLLLGSGKWANIFSGGEGEFQWHAIGTAMILVMFAYSGWNASAYIAGELKNPQKALTLSLVAGTSIVIVLYIAVNAFIFHSLPFSEAKGVIAIVEKASISAFGAWMGKSFGFMVSFALLSSLSAYIIIGPRVYFAMACDKLFFPFAARIHPRFHVPSRSIFIQSSLASIIVLMGSFEQLLVYLGFALGIFPWLAVVGLFLARKKRIGEASAVRMPGYPFVPIFFLGTMLSLMVVTYINRPIESTAAVVTILAGIPCYFIWIKAVRKS